MGRAEPEEKPGSGEGPLVPREGPGRAGVAKSYRSALVMSGGKSIGMPRWPLAVTVS